MFSRTSIVVQVRSFCPNADTYKYGTCVVSDDQNSRIKKTIAVKAYSKETKKQWQGVNVGDVIRIEKPWKYFEKSTGGVARKSGGFNNFDFVIKLHENSKINVIDSITKEVIDSYDKIQSSLKGITVIGEVHAEPEKEKTCYMFSIRDIAGKMMEVKSKKEFVCYKGDKIKIKGCTNFVGKFFILLKNILISFSDGMLTIEAREIEEYVEDADEENKSEEDKAKVEEKKLDEEKIKAARKKREAEKSEAEKKREAENSKAEET